jgi:hypothetical protein
MTLLSLKQTEGACGDYITRNPANAVELAEKWIQAIHAAAT